MAGALLCGEARDSMNELPTYLFGNSIEDCIISLFVFLVSVFIAKHAYRILRQYASRWVGQTRTEFGEKRAVRICTLIACTILITGFTLATNRLILDEELSFWLNNALLISGQIVFLRRSIIMILFTPEGKFRHGLD